MGPTHGGGHCHGDARPAPCPVRAFRERFPLLPEHEYPDARILYYWGKRTDYIVLCGAAKDNAEPYLLITAHLMRLENMAAKGESLYGNVTGASVGGVSVTLQVPQTRGAFNAWLAATPYGQMLQVWLQLHAAGAWQVGGLPERSAFRKVGGVFW
jgi:hypothetical protein